MVRYSWGPPRSDSYRKGDQQGGQWAGFQEYLTQGGQGLASRNLGVFPSNLCSLVPLQVSVHPKDQKPQPRQT